MKQYTEIFVGLDVAKSRHAVAVAEDGRQGEVRYLGEIGADKDSVRRLVAKLEKRHGRRLHFCYEAGPTGYGRSCSTRPWLAGESVLEFRVDSVTGGSIQGRGEHRP